MATQVILLERVDKLGDMGETVSVKPGYARNYLLPQKKALRASKENIAYFEAQKKTLEAENEKRRKDAEKSGKSLEDQSVIILRQASEAGQLYGSVNSRDIAQQISEATGVSVGRSQIDLNRNVKTIGLFDVDVVLHPEVRIPVTINIARTQEEAEIQAETGKALIAEEGENFEEAKVEALEEADMADEQLQELLDDSALEAEKQKQADAKAKAEEAAAQAQAQAEQEEAAAAVDDAEAGNETSQDEDSEKGDS